jgi:hypothetical protein
VMGAWFPGLLISFVITIFGVTFVVRSGQSGPRKAMFITALLLACFVPPVITWMAGLAS